MEEMSTMMRPRSGTTGIGAERGRVESICCSSQAADEAFRRAREASHSYEAENSK